MEHILYNDGLIQLDTEGLTIRHYYFPIATSKRIRYTQIKGVQQWPMGLWTGKGRLWGSGDLRHWFSLDMRRPHKDQALILDLGAWVKPVITPTDPDRVLTLLQEQTART